MTILVTNDDGILAKGLRVLAEVASEFGEVTVVAPQVERSGISHAITLSEPLRLSKLEADCCGEWFALSGTPADCVFIGIHHVLGRKPDLVLSGINRGPNLGYDVLYSGTVGGAMEAVIQGVPSVALSLVCKGSYPFEEMKPHVRAFLAEVTKGGLEPGLLLNVNMPSPEIAPFKGFKITKIGRRFYSNDIVVRKDPRGNEYLWIGGTRVTMEDDPGSDCGAVKRGFISITPIVPDVFAPWAIEGLRRFEGLRPLEAPFSVGKFKSVRGEIWKSAKD